MIKYNGETVPVYTVSIRVTLMRLIFTLVDIVAMSSVARLSPITRTTQTRVKNFTVKF